MPDAIQAIKKRYEFVGIPTDRDIVAATSTVSSPNAPAKPLTFTQGKATVRQRVIAIESLQIFAAGVLVSTRTNTSDSDVIVDDLVSWATSYFDVAFEDLRSGRGYASQIDFRFARPMIELFPQFSGIGALIANNVDEFFDFRPQYELTAFSFWFDKNKYSTFAPPLYALIVAMGFHSNSRYIGPTLL